MRKFTTSGHNRFVADAESIGQRIKRERTSRGMTQRELADRVGVGVPHISKVEGDRENPSDELLGRIAELFEIEAGELLLVARRVPDDLLDRLAADPAQGLQYLRRWDSGSSSGGQGRS